MTELMMFNENQIMVVPGFVNFIGYETLKKQAIKLAEQVSQIEVSDENVQYSKKLLASVNKRVKEMEDRRIAIKKEMLLPYSIFEKQVKEIVEIVNSANDVVRVQLKELEEKERDEKELILKDIFNKRMQHYSFGDIFNFDHFINQKHLNKTTSIKSTEEEMTQWLEKKELDLGVINSLPNTNDVLAEYFDTKDLSIALKIVNEREERKKKAETVVHQTGQTVVETRFSITLFSKKDLLLITMFMDNNKIKYVKEGN